MKVLRVTRRSEFEALAAGWMGVARESGQASPFLSHDWLRCCWSAVEAGREPEVLVVEDRGGPVGLVALAREVTSLHGLPVRTLRMLTVPDSPFADWLVVGRPEPVIDAVMGSLFGRRDWDVLSLDLLPVESPVRKAFEAWLPGRVLSRLGAVVRCPYVTISGSWEAYWSGKSQRFKKTARSVRNRLNKSGLLVVEEHRCLSSDSRVFEELVDVSGRSWKAERGVAIATMPGMRTFFRQLTDQAGRLGWLRVWILRLDGRAVATEYQIEAHGRVHALRADFDASLPDELSPGTHLSGEILRRLFARGDIHEYDMGPGDNAYKGRWATGAREIQEVRIFRPNVYGSVLYGLEARIIPALRGLLSRGA